MTAVHKPGDALALVDIRQTGVALNLTANRRFVDTNLVCDGSLRQTSFLQRINLVTPTLSEAVMGSY